MELIRRAVGKKSKTTNCRKVHCELFHFKQTSTVQQSRFSIRNICKFNLEGELNCAHVCVSTFMCAKPQMCDALHVSAD